ncbi:hypothetical protein [Acinetobacter soli]|uniref:hypothetical protein n=1 Tax=Acinetobacter soli TaxID=487316 RepID=UPI00124FDBA2|nr:hypothetical protein [Acinetobacter soli]
MRYYIKKGDLYLHVGTVAYEEYQDYSDIDAMHMTQYRFLKQKDGAKNFLSGDEADTYRIKRKIRGAEVAYESP